jgi:hypothetical protein
VWNATIARLKLPACIRISEEDFAAPHQRIATVALEVAKQVRLLLWEKMPSDSGQTHVRGCIFCQH